MGRETVNVSARVAAIACTGARTHWRPGDALRDELAHRAADPALRNTLDELAGQTLDDLSGKWAWRQPPDGG